MTSNKPLLTVVLTLALGLGVWTLAFTFQSATFADGDVLSATELNAILNDNFQAASDAVNEKVDRAGDAMTGPLEIAADATTSDDSTAFQVQNTAATGVTAVFQAASSESAVGILQDGEGPVLTLKTTGTGPLIVGNNLLVGSDGNIEIAGNITNGVDSALPVAFGYVYADGTLEPDSSTSNVSVTLEAGPRYRIVIDDETYDFRKYPTSVTPGGSEARFASTNSVSGDALVYIYDSGGTEIQDGFSFVIFKPGG